MIYIHLNWGLIIFNIIFLGGGGFGIFLILYNLLNLNNEKFKEKYDDPNWGIIIFIGITSVIAVTITILFDMQALQIVRFY